MSTSRKDLQISAGITLLGGLMLLLFNIGEVLRLSSFTYTTISFVAAISVILSAVLFYTDADEHLRYGIIAIFSSLFLFLAERLANILAAIAEIQTPPTTGGNPFGYFFLLGIFLSALGGILLITYQEKSGNAKAK
jgi:hypothetical protein